METRNAPPSPNALARSDVLRACALIVGPDPANQPIYASVLAQAGVDCICASSTQEAVSSLTRLPCIGIFLDSIARLKGGLDVAKQAREIAGLERTPIIFVSAAPADEIDDPEVRGIGLVDYLPFPLDQRLLQRKVALLLELHRQQIEELRGRRIAADPWDEKNGARSEQTQSMSSAPVRNAEGHIIGSVSVARDVTETKPAEERLRAAVDQARAAEAKSRATLAAELVAMQRLHDISTTAMTTNDQQVLLEAILDATIALHAAASGSVQLLDPSSETLHIAAQRGMDAETLERFAKVDARTNSACGRVLARRERVIIEDAATDRTGTFDPETAQRMGLVAVHSTPLFTTNGAILGVLSTHFRSPRKFSPDELRITDLYAHQVSIAIERRRAEAALIAARESADRANKAKSHFVRAASHDLRQSVQALALLNGILRDSTLDASGRAALGQQSEAIDTMMHLLDALLNISKLESGAVAPSVTDFTVTTLFEKLRMEFSSLAANQGLELKIDTPMPQAIRSDPTLVGEILRNFLSNAIKFTPQGSITLRSSQAGLRVRLEVIDTGIGIPRDELPLIFGEFYQVGVSATLSRQGHGLGLSIVQRIAALLAADVEVDSEPGQGSAFSLTVSAGDLDLVIRAARASKQRATRNTTSSTLLLVEDDVLVRTSMEHFLRSYGYSIVSAASLDQALAVVDKLRRLDLLITDFHLPNGQTGSDVIRCVRDALGGPLPAIMFSGDTSAESEDLSHEVAVHFVSKPVDPDSFVELVQKLLAQSSSCSHRNTDAG